MTDHDESRFALANAELNARTRTIALTKGVSKILKSLKTATDTLLRDFLANPVSEGLYSREDLEKRYIAAIRPVLKELPELLLKELLLYGERRLRAKAGGKLSVSLRQEKIAARNKIIIQRHQALSKIGKKRAAAAIIAKAFKLTATQVRSIIRNEKK
jgi:hypothetical protein